MEKKNRIYKITNLKTGKAYVGQTINTLNYRFMHHCKPSSGVPALNAAISKYGRESFKIELICECTDLNHANEMEIYYIKKLTTISPNGYNLEEGGKFVPKSPESIKKAAETKRGMKYPSRRRGIIATNTITGEVIEVEVVKDFLGYGFTKSNLSNIRTVLAGKTNRQRVRDYTFVYKRPHANQSLIVENKKSTAAQRIVDEPAKKQNISGHETSTPNL